MNRAASRDAAERGIGARKNGLALRGRSSLQSLRPGRIDA